MQINWYPGHMSKAKRLLKEQAERVDAVIEICDARLPYSSRNPELSEITKGKQRLLLLNKSDLADREMTEKWLSFFRGRGLLCMSVTAGKNMREVISAIEKMTRPKVEHAAKRGIRRTVRVMVVGVPNVGKSTLINRMHGGNIARVADRPGVTRASQWVRVGDYLELLDTPGLLWPRLDDVVAAKRLAYISAVKDEVVDSYGLACSLLEDLQAAAPDMLKMRYRIEDRDLKGQALMEAVCRGRGFLLRGAEPDLDRACATVLDEFRNGKLGKITLESPQEETHSYKTGEIDNNAE